MSKVAAKRMTSSKPSAQNIKKPIWKGPEEDGITQSLLGKFLCCRERFRLLVVEGLTEADSFNHRIEYGNMWQVCEEAFAGSSNHVVVNPNAGNNLWIIPLTNYCKKLCKKYPLQQPEIDKWYDVCKIQFLVYTSYWLSHLDVKNRTPLLQEEVFCVPYKLPSGRVVKLRGKWDSVDLIGKKKSAPIWLQENKTKGEIKEEQLVRQLTFDLQTMFYLIALYQFQNDDDRIPHAAVIRGVRYNVVRRPLSGGKGNISQKKGSKNVPPETRAEYYDRLRGIIEKDPDYYFMRWQVVITPADIERFKQECLNPILEQLCDWWECHIKYVLPSPFCNSCHYRLPYGIYNPMTEGRTSELDEYLASGSTLGLEKTTNLFPELN